ncbi:CPBP family intramembrane glutamic endopeptidase [Clostridium sp. CCUG 7971]|uniref:CPBP family intramembrane glutamic endopeptidase n=1 Tax=Clostridium sp. CCUG 7971 TaxID=2811414 RepID=UPI001ABBBBD6|nr:CPBP family intramembrane glutamic endopeptidase [Clostridium sp. CCUG 7971]MBO3445617.1 CPBP family intramembrane metalloprotease [Clostridium sp. CCUG 7971]
MRALKSIYKNECQIKEISILKSFIIMAIFLAVPVLINLIATVIMILINENISFGTAIVVGSIIIIVSNIIVVSIIGRKSIKKDNDEIIRNKMLITKKEFLYVFLIIIGYMLIREVFLFDALAQFEGPISENDIDFILNNLSTIEIGMVGLTLAIQVVITAPILEELLFRGIILNGLLSKYKKNYKKAIIISALIFGVAHLNIPQGVNAFIIGIVIGGIYYSTGSMKLSIFAHFINNFLFLPTPENLLFKSIYAVLGIYLLIKGIKSLKYKKINSLKDNDYNINS